MPLGPALELMPIVVLLHSVTTPPGVTRAMVCIPYSLIQIFPSGPVVSKRRFDTVLRRPFDLGIIQAYPHSLRGLHA